MVLGSEPQNNLITENLLAIAQSYLTIASLLLFTYSRLARIILATWIFAYDQMLPTYHGEIFCIYFLY